MVSTRRVNRSRVRRADSQAPRRSTADEAKQQPLLLVLGDWLVDEHWVCGLHRSSTSSRTGQLHLRALHSELSDVQAFCGAGRSASFLRQLYSESSEAPTSIIGVGFWHHADTEALASLFAPEAPPRSMYRLTAPQLATPKGIELVNMNDALNFNLKTEERDGREYTTRVIRIYRHGEDDQVLYERLDWEPRSPRPWDTVVKWSVKELARLSAAVKKQLGDRRVTTVVVKDMQKGVVNDETIDWLIAVAPKEARWYVSTKKWRPSWLSKLKNVDLRLLTVPQVPAAEAVHRPHEGEQLTRWITRSGKPSGEAIALVDHLANETQAATVLILPDKMSALYCSTSGGSVATSVVQSRPEPEKVTVDMGNASIVFPAMVGLLESRYSKEMSPEKVVSLALRTAYEWVESEAERVFHPRDWRADPLEWHGNSAFRHLRDLIAGRSTDAPVPKPFGAISVFDWPELRKEWREAMSDVGVIGHSSKEPKALELWRSMLEVEDYVCCDEATRSRLRSLVHGVQAFARRPRHHSSCMLVAAPGSGKTFLAKRVAQAAGLRFLPFNITQMRSKADILECLDTIVAAQAEASRDRLLVFIDEINAELESAPVYGAFLTPLEDGTYIRAGKTFTIQPCVWMFAGTSATGGDAALTDAGTSRTRASKESDFLSRLSMGVIDLTRSGRSGGDEAEDTVERAMAETVANKRVEELHGLENVYLGAAILKQEFPDVRRVSELVLRAFWELPRSIKIRDIKHFIRRFDDIQYGQVTARSVPLSDWPGGNAGLLACRRWREWRSTDFYPDKPTIAIVTPKESTLPDGGGLQL